MVLRKTLLEEQEINLINMLDTINERYENNNKLIEGLKLLQYIMRCFKEDEIFIETLKPLEKKLIKKLEDLEDIS